VLLQSDYEDVDQIQATPSGGDDWKLVDELDEQDTLLNVASASSKAVKTRKAFIEDSDWDEAEVIE
jgi:structure-specific endonuclease subunit SLX1